MVETEQPTLWTKPFLLVWAFTFLTFFAAFQLFPTAPLRLIELGASRGESGSFLAVFTIGSSLGALVTGPLGDRVGHRRMMGGAALAFIAIMGVYSVLPVRWAFYALAPLHGAIWSGLITATVAMLGGIVPESRRAEGMALYGLASPGGVIFGPTVGVWIFQHAGFRAMCLLLALCFAVLTVLARNLPPDPAREHRSDRHFSWPERPVLMLSSILFVTALGYGALNSYSAQEGLALDLRVHGWAWPSAFFSSLAVGMVAMRALMGITGFGERPTRRLPAMVLLALSGLALLAFVPDAWVGGLARHVVSGLIYGAGYSMVYTLLNTILLEIVAPERRGAAFGTFMFAFDAGIGLGSALLGHLIGAQGFRAGWAAAVAVMALGLPLAVGITRRHA
ncbi:MAG TPA: MFS transporter [Holophagaceae bacterium]|nr:MFS transporter [Holophagaceae bacterium]